ncbi:MAG: hypothetical protein ACLQAH_18360 [Limisphaerales bacterium]
MPSQQSGDILVHEVDGVFVGLQRFGLQNSEFSLQPFVHHAGLNPSQSWQERNVIIPGLTLSLQMADFAPQADLTGFLLDRRPAVEYIVLIP